MSEQGITGERVDSGTTGRLRILFVTGASHEKHMRNMNHFQRVYFLSRQVHLTVFGRRDATFSSSAAEGTEIVHARFNGKLGVIMACVLWMLTKGRSKRYDIILTEPSKLCVCGLLGKIILGAKWVVDVWDIPFRCGSRSAHLVRRLVSKADRRIARFLFKYADLFIMSIRPDIEFREFRVPGAKMLALKNAIWLDGVERQPFGERDTANKIFMILCMRSHFTGDMGLDLLAHAFDKLCREYDNVGMTIVGDIPGEVKPQVASLVGRPNVYFHRFLEHGELMSLVCASNACVIPFRNTMDLAQTYPIKLLEYLLCGAVVVAADLQGIASILTHGVNGLLFKAGDSLDLVEKLRVIYADSEYAAKISAGAVALRSEFDCRSKAKTILIALEGLCAKEGLRSGSVRKEEQGVEGAWDA